MPLDVSGALLEGIRISEGNNPYSFPPRDVVSNPSVFSSVSSRAEYVLITASSDPSKLALEIADPDLVFLWTKNESTVQRFAYSSYSKRWLPSPGSFPDELGPLSNDERLTMPVPDTSLTDAPFSLYVGSPSRVITFTVVVVGDPGDFTPLPSGTAQVSSTDGKLNFSDDDVLGYGGQTVLLQRQSFFDGKSVIGSIGTLPASSAVSYFFFMNPRPASGQVPRVRISYGLYLVGTEYATESALPLSPPSGTFAWSADTGRVVLSPADVDANAGKQVYYDGVTMGSVAPARTALAGPLAPWPASAFTVPLDSVGVLDQRYVLYAELNGVRSYFTMVPRTSAPTSAPLTGTFSLRADTGQAYLSAIDVADFSAWSFAWLDTLMPVEDGVSVQVYRSGVNGSGEPQVDDFTVLYAVEDQILVDGMSQSPFVMLPTTPVEDSTLTYRVEQGPSSSGTFAGDLADGTDPSEAGLGYLLNLDQHQLKFCFRKTVTVTLQTATPSVKLADAAISPLGIEATVNGTPAVPGVDFGFDAGTGVLSFTEPFGQSDPGDLSGQSGVASGSFLTPAGPGFSASDEGKWVLVTSGANEGIRQITSVNLGVATVDPPFSAPGAILYDIRSSADVVADRFWAEVDPPYKTFSLATAQGASGPFSAVPRSGFSVLPSVSQINLTDPAPPGQSYLATYVGLVTDDDGATYTPVNTVELAAFKVRQETATSTVGSSVVQINPEGRTVDTSSVINVYINGVPLGETYFRFEAPGTIQLSNPVLAGQTVVVDYYVQEALGGETSFQLKVQPMDLDSLQIAAGASSFTANGDQTGLVSDGSIVWAGQAEAALVAESSYDSADDVTTVTLVAPMATASASAEILSCAPVDDYVQETAAVSTFVQGSNSFTVGGDVSSSYRQGTIVVLSATDAYVVLSSEYVPARLLTRVTLYSPARKNYIIPSVERSSRPVYLPGTTFQTSRDADLSSPFQLVRMGDDPAILALGVDYDVAAGGVMALKQELSFGDELVALYVAYLPQPAGTVISMNYAYAVAPSQQNGLVGQRLVSDYVLYAPDTFFYRVETILTFLPEVQDLLRQGAQSSGASGPNTQSATGMSNKDFGRASLYYDEQHQGNLDTVTIRLLLFYNDFVNLYENLLSDLDGRVVGGLSGPFRFDGNTDNPPRQSYDDVTNDIDDRVKLYDRLQLVSFYSFQQVPVYGTMAFPNALSRIFPTSVTKSAALSDEVTSADRGAQIGSLDVENIRSVGTIRSARSNQFFTSVSGTSYTVAQNGSEDDLVPPFEAGQDVQVYAEDGTPDVSGSVVSVSGSGPYVVELDVATSLSRGSILRDVSSVPATPAADTNHFYQAGRDIGVDFDNGQLINVTVGPPFIPDLGGSQLRVWGSEIVDAPLTYNNGDLAAKRIPALDGSGLDDDGRVPAPRLRRVNESELLEDELTAMSGVGLATSVVSTGRVQSGGTVVASTTLLVQVGDIVVFTAGPNAGLRRAVLLILGPSSFQLSSPLLVDDATDQAIASLSLLTSSLPTAVPAGSNVAFLDGPNDGLSYAVQSSSVGFFRVLELAAVDPGSHFESATGTGFISDIVALELGVLYTNLAVTPSPPAVVAQLDSEMRTILSLVQYSGPVLASGSGTAAGTTLTDLSAGFVLAGVVAGTLLLVPSGSNIGLYRVASATSTVLTLDTASPFAALPFAGATPYQVIQPESFLRPAQWGPLSLELRETWAFYLSTLAWYGNITTSGVPARQAAIVARQAQLAAYYVALGKTLVDGKLYDVRYLWIDQRVNRQDGNFVKEAQASANRVKNLAKMLADQQKLLVSEAIT